MLNSLAIKNYRNLKSLEINSLGRVNLITGKNNTGKSTLLEAIAIYATKGNLNLIDQLLGDRGEVFKQSNESSNPIGTFKKAVLSLFHNRVIGFNFIDAISIGRTEDLELREQGVINDGIVMRLVKYNDEINRNELGKTVITRKYLRDNSEVTESYKTGFEIARETHSTFFPFNNTHIYSAIFDFDEPDELTFKNNLQFIKARNIAKDSNGTLFDKIALTDKEQQVIKALKIIEPLTERIAFVGEANGERNAVIKLSNFQQIMPLQSMGDGMDRILSIILALVNADNGFLLIDEFENGLHYSVQEKLWKIIFELSKELNVQMFATTHSRDCIKGFEAVLNAQDDLSDGKLIRLDNKNGIIKQVEFDAKELKIAAEQGIEIR